MKLVRETLVFSQGGGPVCIKADPTRGRQQQGEQRRPSHQRVAPDIPPALSREEVRGRGQKSYGVYGPPRFLNRIAAD